MVVGLLVGAGIAVPVWPPCSIYWIHWVTFFPIPPSLRTYNKGRHALLFGN